jgi:TonB-dependent starch-binding outer membrane protein SusC
MKNYESFYGLRHSRVGKIKSIFSLFALLFCFAIFQVKAETPLDIAQPQGKITGTVTIAEGEPIIGATVLIKGTSTGTVTNVDGKYELDLPVNNATILFSFIGMISQEVAVGNQTEINITLEEDTYGIEEVIAIGYGTVKKANVTNAVAKINSDAIENRPLTTLSEAFSGQIAGVYAQQASGLPGKDFEIKIRGTNTITSGTGPLYVVDGMPVSDMTDFNMNDVASVEVLKDASAAAIYGARGAGGIVLITTKSGKPGDTKIDFEAYTGVQAVSNKIELMDADQWMEYTEWNKKEKYRRDGKGDPFADPSITFDVMGSKYWTRKFWYGDDRDAIMSNTDWQDEGLQPATKNNFQITLTKGVESGSFLVSGNYLDQEGLFKGTSFKRYNFRSNARYDINKRIEVGMNLSASHSLADGYNNGEGKESPYMRLIVADPTVPVDGNTRSHEYGLLTGDPNPIIQSQVITDDTKTTRTLGNMFANFQIIDGLKLGGQYGLDIRSIESTWFKPMYVNKKARREGDQNNVNSLRSLVQGTLSYDKTFGDHTIGLLAGSSYEESHSKRVNIDSWDFASDDIHTFNTAATFRNWNDTETEWSLLSYFSRASYNYSDKYIVSASIRRDGSSRFGKDTKFGIFPAASAAWRVSEEDFFEDVSIITNMKVRLSWGQTGNDNIGNYSSFGRLSNYNYSYGGNLAFGFAPTSADNPTLTWETNTTTDFGIDLGFLGNRITLAADYYINKTTDLLLDVPAPAITGFPGSVTLNSGSVENKGWEFEVSSTNVQSSALGGIRWKTSFNISHNENEVTSLGYGIKELIGELRSVPTHITKVGLPIRSFFLYDFIGLLTEADMADANVAKFNKQEAGNLKIRDVNEDGIINDADRTVVGSNHPDLIFGMTNSLQIGDFDLSILFTGVTGFDTYFMFGRYIDSGGTGRNQMPNWSNGYRSAAQPGDGQTPYPYGANPEFTDRWMYKGDYYRIKNLTFGYRIPTEVLSKINMRSLRAYVSIDNLLNLTDYPGGNPESNVFSAGNDYAQGTDYGTFPLTRTIIFGVKVGF